MAARFDRAAAERPELPQVRPSVELLDRLRGKSITLGVLRWTVSKERLTSMVSHCLRVIQRLEPGTAAEVRNVEDVLRELT